MVCPKTDVGSNISRVVTKMVDACKSSCSYAPITRKCCFCVPVRKGVIILGYVYMGIQLLSLSLLLILLTVELENKDAPNAHKVDATIRDLLVYVPMATVLNVIDLIMTIVLLIGAHKNNVSLLKFYFYFGVVFQLLTLWMELHYFDHLEYVENSLYLLDVGLNVYLLYMVYSTMRVIKEHSRMNYVEYRENSHLNI